MNCSNCGNEIDENQKFCANCGAKIEDVADKTNEFNLNDFIHKNIFIIILTMVIVFGVIYYPKSSQDAITYAQTNDEFTKDGYRFIYATMPSKFLANEQIEGTHFNMTVKWYLFELFKFQNMTPKKRIVEFEKDYEDPHANELVKNQLVIFIDENSTYKIADNYCIKYEIKEEENIGKMEKTTCTQKVIPIEKLPFERCLAFKESDERGTYYKSYNIQSLWDEFQTKGIDNIEKEFDAEIDYWFKIFRQRSI